MKDRHKKDNLQVQFRSGTAVGKRLAAQARRWKVSTNEAARRLVILGLLGLTRDQHEVLTQLEDDAGTEDFTEACGQALVAVDVYEQMTSKSCGLPPTPGERFTFLTTWAKGFVSGDESTEVAPGGPEQAAQEVVRRIRVRPRTDAEEKAPK